MLTKIHGKGRSDVIGLVDLKAAREGMRITKKKMGLGATDNLVIELNKANLLRPHQRTSEHARNLKQ